MVLSVRKIFVEAKCFARFLTNLHVKQSAFDSFTEESEDLHAKPSICLG